MSADASERWLLPTRQRFEGGRRHLFRGDLFHASILLDVRGRNRGESEGGHMTSSACSRRCTGFLRVPSHHGRPFARLKFMEQALGGTNVIHQLMRFNSSCLPHPLHGCSLRRSAKGPSRVVKIVFVLGTVEFWASSGGTRFIHPVVIHKARGNWKSRCRWSVARRSLVDA